MKLGYKTIDATKYISYADSYSRKIDEELDRIFARESRMLEQINPPASVGELAPLMRGFMQGGKKMRGTLVSLGADSVRGSQSLDDEQMLGDLIKASAAVEVIHSSLLIHDDIIDQDATRRGSDSLHVSFSKKFQELWHNELYWREDPCAHYGVSMALNAADAGVFLAMEILGTLQLPAERTLSAIRNLSSAFRRTAHGQALDIVYQWSDDLSEAQIFDVYTYKTAYYSVVGPLQIGAILAGGSDEHVEKLRKFGLPIGQAFQLMDDLLGLFGNQNQIGKPLGSDLKEGKKTLILSKLLDSLKPSNPEAHRFLKALVQQGNPSQLAVENIIEKVREMAESTGAHEYCESKARQLTDQSKAMIPEITNDEEVQETLHSFAEFVVTREY